MASVLKLAKLPLLMTVLKEISGNLYNVHYRLETEAVKMEEIAKNVNLLKSHRKYIGIDV